MRNFLRFFLGDEKEETPPKKKRRTSSEGEKKSSKRKRTPVDRSIPASPPSTKNMKPRVTKTKPKVPAGEKVGKKLDFESDHETKVNIKRAIKASFEDQFLLEQNKKLMDENKEIREKYEKILMELASVKGQVAEASAKGFKEGLEYMRTLNGTK